MAKTTYRKLEMSMADAALLIERARGTRFFLHASTWLPAAGSKLKDDGTRSGFVAGAVIRVGRRDLLSFIAHSVSAQIRERVQIQITRGSRSIFVGASI